MRLSENHFTDFLLKSTSLNEEKVLKNLKEILKFSK